MTAYPGCAGLGRSPFVLTKHISGVLYNWRASKVSETLSGVYKFELVRYVYTVRTYVYVRMEMAQALKMFQKEPCSLV